MAADYSKIVEQYIKVHGSPADLYAGLVGATAASSAPEWAAAATNLVKVGDAFLSLVKEIPIIGNTANALSLGLNLRLASADIATLGYVSRAVHIALLGDVAAVGSGLGFVYAAGGVVVLGMSTPVLVAAASLAATVGIASTFYSATRGIADKELEKTIVKSAAEAAKGLGKFNDISWAGTEVEAVDKLKGSAPILYPIVELLHILSPSLTVTEALKIVDASASGATLQEASAALNKTWGQVF